MTSTPSGRNYGSRVGIPIPRFKFIPDLTSLAALATILFLTKSLWETLSAGFAG